MQWTPKLGRFSARGEAWGVRTESSSGLVILVLVIGL